MGCLRYRKDSGFGSIQEFIAGRNSRWENRTQHRTGLIAHVRNRDLGYDFSIDLDAGVFTAWRAHQHGGPAWMTRTRKQPEPERSGSTVHIHRKTIDTGDSKMMFGYPARRMVITITTRRVGELAQESENDRYRLASDPESDGWFRDVARESESDGWYIDPPAVWREIYRPGRGHLYAAFGSKKDDLTITHEGEQDVGFPVVVEHINRTYSRREDGVLRSNEDTSREEVTEFSEDELDPGLFVPPPNCRRVMRLDEAARVWPERGLRRRWEMLTDRYGLVRQLIGRT